MKVISVSAHVTSPPTFQSGLRLWLLLDAS